MKLSVAVEPDDQERVAEYNSLRQEIMSRQTQRHMILGFTLTVILTAGALSVKPEARSEAYPIFCLAVFVFIVLFGALLLSIQHTQMNHIIAGYIRTEIESKAAGMGWEAWWLANRFQGKPAPKGGRIGPLLPYGQSKSLALCYLVITTAAILRFGSVLWACEAKLHCVVIVALAAACLYLAFDFYICRSPWWRNPTQEPTCDYSWLPWRWRDRQPQTLIPEEPS